MKQYLLFIILSFVCFDSYAQTAAISNDRGNIVYLGITNPVTAVAENCDCKQIILHTDNGNISGSDCRFSLIPKHLGTAVVSMYRLKGKDSVLLGSIEYKVNKLMPVLKLRSACNDSISLDSLQTASLYLVFENLCIEGVSPRLSSYNISAFRNDSLLFSSSELSGFNEHAKSLLKLLKEGDRLVFSNISGIVAGGYALHIEPVEYVVKP